MMRKFLYCLFLIAICITTSATNYYLSTNGSDSNSGTSSSSAFKTLAHAVSVVQAGDVIHVASGTYHESTSPIVITSSGNSSNRITIKASGSQPVFHFNGNESSSNRGVVMDGDYWNWENIIIENAGDNGMLLSGNNNNITNCVFRANYDTGLQLSRYNTSASSISEWPSNNTITSCVAYDNCDSDNEDADGFAAKLTCGTGNVFDKCIAHHNIDDGWDLYTKSSTGVIGIVTFKDCIAHHNGTLTNGSASGSGDKNGFKLGSSSNTVDHILIRCVAYSNGKHGFTDNGNIGNIKFINLTSYNNGDYNYHTRDNASHLFLNCISYQGKDRIVGTASNAHNALIDEDYNFNYTVSSSDFSSLSEGSNDDPCSGNFLKLSASSSLINAGATSSYLSSYSGSKPDLGAFEYGSANNDDDEEEDDEGYVSLTSSAGDGAVSLQWSINNLDINSVQIYRDTDSDPSGRSRIAVVSTSTNSYTDGTVSNGTTYYYWIKVRDTSNNFTNSNSASATPTSGNTSGNSGSIIEDNDSRLISYDGSLKSYSNANNGYAINLSNSAGKEIEWSYNASNSGTHTILLRYTKKSSMSGTAYIYVNGTKVKTINLSTTSSGVFASASFSTTLQSGTNTIVLQTSEGGEFADIDYIEISMGTKSAVGINNQADIEFDAVAYPNPCHQSITIQCNAMGLQSAGIYIHDLNGRMVYSESIHFTSSNTQELTINTSNLPQGVYTYSLISNTHVIHKKFMKE